MELCGTAQEWQCLKSTRSKPTLSQNSMSRANAEGKGTGLSTWKRVSSELGL